MSIRRLRRTVLFAVLALGLGLTPAAQAAPSRSGKPGPSIRQALDWLERAWGLFPGLWQTAASTGDPADGGTGGGSGGHGGGSGGSGEGDGGTVSPDDRDFRNEGSGIDPDGRG